MREDSDATHSELLECKGARDLQTPDRLSPMQKIAASISLQIGTFWRSSAPFFAMVCAIERARFAERAGLDGSEK